MKRKLIALAMSVFCIASAIPSSIVYADGQKVVTLGADLTEDQKQAVLRYFGIAGQNIQTLTITNQDERNHLGSYVPLEQIGTKTFSCALVSPTTSGGIQVKTANLSWVTSNMIATTLSTSGVVNCDVLAASPFEVSGTGALTGIMMAYESAVGTTLDETKKEIATQEMITTANLANTIGQQEATEIVNGSKIQVIQETQENNITQNDIDVIINQVAEENNITLSDEDRDLLNQLLDQIAQQDYDYEEMKDTLERVENNMNEMSEQIAGTETVSTEITSETTEETQAADAAAQTETPETLADDSILMNTDDSALGGATFDATDSSALTETEAPAQTEATGEFEITSSDTYNEDGTTGTDETSPTESTSIDLPAEPAESTDLNTEMDTNAETDSGADISTLELNVIPLSDLMPAPVTSDSNNYEVSPAGTNELTISFQREDLVAGNGTLTVFNAADSTQYDQINMNDVSKVTIVALTPEELMENGWSTGYKALIHLNQPLQQSSTYYINLSQDALMTSDGSGSSEAISDSSTWMIQTSEYGFGLNTTTVDGITAGSSVTGQIYLDGSMAASAVIENFDESMVTFDQTEFMTSSAVNATFWNAGETSFDINFYDEAGNQLYTMTRTVTIH